MRREFRPVWPRLLAGNVLLAVIIAGCTPEQEQVRVEGETGIGDSVQVQIPPQGVEPTLPSADSIEDQVVSRDTILLEGNPEEIEVRQVRSPAGFPLSFTTTVPGDMDTSFEANAVRFEAVFGGVRSPQAFLEVRVLGPGADREAAREAALAEAGDSPLEEVRPPRIEWAAEEYRRRGADLGFLAIAERNGRWYYFNARYPAEYADGMGPRLGLVLDRWEWTGGP